jgi:hypothetical protein
LKKCLLIIALIISLLFGTYTFITQQEQKKYANEGFIYCINQAASCFAIDYNKVGDEDKVSYYMNAAANLHTAMSILPFTSYANVENKTRGSANALSRLYMSISLHATPQSTNRLIAFSEKKDAIFTCLYHIGINPNDKKNWESLSKIAEDIGY